MVGILGANSVSGGYEISNSLRFNDGDSPRLTFTPSSAGNRKTLTLSVWIKLQSTTTTERCFLAADDSTDNNGNMDYMAINPVDRMHLYTYEGGEDYVITGTQNLRDPSAWYHMVIAFDTTQGTDTNRIKMYLNGSQVTDLASSNYPSLNKITRYNNNNRQRIGSYPEQDASYFDGYMAEYHLIDGQQLTPSDFGEFNNNGVWIPKAYEGTYGTNGFYLEFKETGTGQNSSGIGADTSGNDHHWAVTNFTATDVTTDTPTNNFATWNINTINPSTTNTFAQGNLQCTSGGAISTFAMPSGKWYWEIRCNNSDADQAIGVYSVTESSQTSISGGTDPTHGFIYQANGNARKNGTVVETWSTFTNGDIISFAYDSSTRILNAYKNNSFVGDITVTDSGDVYSPNVMPLGGNFIANFGQEGSFAGLETAGGNADENGYGNFKYAPPSGYYSLCTKNLGEFG